MQRTPAVLLAAVLLAAGTALLVARPPARAHCDGLDGPVVAAAREALAAGDAARVLHWVKKEHEPAIRAAFSKTLAVRGAGSEARDLADLWFFETVVRVHREGEGAPFTGLKPAGRDPGPVVTAADRAVAEGNVDPLVRSVTTHVEHGLRERFARVQATRNFKAGDVAAGREFVEAYVTFLHYAEGLHAAAEGAGRGHGEDGPPPHPGGR